MASGQRRQVVTRKQKRGLPDGVIWYSKERTYSLDGLPSAVLVIEMAGGARFTNQVGCVLCQHGETTGLLFPLTNTVLPGQPFSFEHCDPTGAQIIAALEAQPGITHAQVGELVEAWVRVTFDFYGVPQRGVVTWENCD